ncbi:thioredoxin-dependent thiol peroxidase [Pseudotabrizicola alkalilacus]|uniref:thioredoxin-dependent peroxiredoxin n=1 Tax=Pseudotabrizicola alkalilacus TaxID=2305252 RepID=A0A411YZ28_9RHOB|nr:thioredoxin-dependent thiol peroxidase [Pseudotabrizicola alkalilacus]RGP36057.1 thioredoxin-dependent thiol peroxidase [Pseudotabrizicola alkalilacus]
MTTQIPETGTISPDFTLPRDGGETATLSAFRPGKVVLYFYPKDDTPGCTLEAQDFTARAAEFAAAGTTVIGISKDSVKAHDKFCKKHGLQIILASDEDGQTCEDYGVWAEKSMYGKTYMGITRATFLIDAEGKIARIWPKVSVKGHADEVLAAAQAL